MSEEKATRPLWRSRVADKSPQHRMRDDDEYVAVCGYSFRFGSSSATLHPGLHDRFHGRCRACVEKSP